MTNSMKKVRAKWYTTRVAGDFMDAVDVDVSKGNDSWDQWEVTFRDDIELNAHNIRFLFASFDKAANAKRFALAVAEALRNGDDCPNSLDFEEFAELTYRFRAEDWQWNWLKEKVQEVA